MLMPDTCILSDVQQALPDINVSCHLHTGGQKQVYKCTFNQMDAVLKLAENREDNEERVRREIAAMRVASSPYLVRVLTDEIQNIRVAEREYVYFIEEYVDGNDLREVIQRDWTYPQIIHLTRNLVDAVENLWQHRIVHRDINPKNIRVKPNDDGILLDVGIARHIDRSPLTPMGVTYGTMGYMSPEQLRGLRTDLDFRSDCFLIGICLYEIIAKINPYTQNFTGEREYAERVLHGNVDPVSSFDNSVPAALNELIMRFLKPYANLRPRTFNVIYTLLDRAAEEV